MRCAPPLYVLDTFLLSPFFPSKTRQDMLYNTKLTSREIGPFFLAMFPEDLEAKKHVLVHNILKQIYTLFHENTKKWKKLVKKPYVRTK